MLVIKDLEDLKKYLEARRDLAEKQKPTTLIGHSRGHCHGMIYGFDESIRAVEALMRTEQGISNQSDTLTTV